MIINRIFNKIKRIIFYYSNRLFYGYLGKNSIIRKPIRVEKKKYIFLGDRVSILDGARIEAIDNWNGVKVEPRIIIEDDCDIGQGLHLTSYSKVHIHKNTLIAPYVYITDVMHDYEEIELPVSKQSLHSTPTEIDEDCWIGIGVKIFAGVHIGRHCIIGANSVVTHDISDYSVAVGCPAKVIKQYNFEKKEWEKIDF